MDSLPPVTPRVAPASATGAGEFDLLAASVYEAGHWSDVYGPARLPAHTPVPGAAAPGHEYTLYTGIDLSTPQRTPASVQPRGMSVLAGATPGIVPAAELLATGPGDDMAVPETPPPQQMPTARGARKITRVPRMTAPTAHTAQLVRGATHLMTLVADALPVLPHIVEQASAVRVASDIAARCAGGRTVTAYDADAVHALHLEERPVPQGKDAIVIDCDTHVTSPILGHDVADAVTQWPANDDRTGPRYDIALVLTGHTTAVLAFLQALARRALLASGDGTRTRAFVRHIRLHFDDAACAWPTVQYRGNDCDPACLAPAIRVLPRGGHGPSLLNTVLGGMIVNCGWPIAQEVLVTYTLRVVALETVKAVSCNPADALCAIQTPWSGMLPTLVNYISKTLRRKSESNTQYGVPCALRVAVHGVLPDVRMRAGRATFGSFTRAVATAQYVVIDVCATDAPDVWRVHQERLRATAVSGVQLSSRRDDRVAFTVHAVADVAVARASAAAAARRAHPHARQWGCVDLDAVMGAEPDIPTGSAPYHPCVAINAHCANTYAGLTPQAIVAACAVLRGDVVTIHDSARGWLWPIVWTNPRCMEALVGLLSGAKVVVLTGGVSAYTIARVCRLASYGAPPHLVTGGALLPVTVCATGVSLFGLSGVPDVCDTSAFDGRYTQRDVFVIADSKVARELQDADANRAAACAMMALRESVGWTMFTQPSHAPRKPRARQCDEPERVVGSRSPSPSTEERSAAKRLHHG